MTTTHDIEPVQKPRRRRRKRLAIAGWTLLFTAITLVIGASIHLPARNPGYLATESEVSAEADRMRAEPVTLSRPVIVLAGYRSPAMSASNLAANLRELTGAQDDQIISLGYPLADNVESPARRVVEEIETRWPSDDPDFTIEVDVVAISMGGIVARLAADDPELRGEPGGKRLRIGTLYTLGTPHRGSRLAQHIRPDSAARALAPGSELIEALNDRQPDAAYDIVPYAILHDRMVGATHSAPPGQDPIWVPGRIFFGHHMISLEERIYADVALRLRGEDPLAAPSPAPRD